MLAHNSFYRKQLRKNMIGGQQELFFINFVLEEIFLSKLQQFLLCMLKFLIRMKRLLNCKMTRYQKISKTCARVFSIKIKILDIHLRISFHQRPYNKSSSKF
jgi:hypothetical protein